AIPTDRYLIRVSRVGAVVRIEASGPDADPRRIAFGYTVRQIECNGLRRAVFESGCGLLVIVDPEIAIAEPQIRLLRQIIGDVGRRLSPQSAHLFLSASSVHVGTHTFANRYAAFAGR